jgi:hypothetical protein
MSENRKMCRMLQQTEPLSVIGTLAAEMALAVRRE